MFESSQNSYSEGLPPKVIVFGGGASEKLLGLDEVMRVVPPRWDWCPFKKEEMGDLLSLSLSSPPFSISPPTSFSLHLPVMPAHVSTQPRRGLSAEAGHASTVGSDPWAPEPRDTHFCCSSPQAVTVTQAD